MTPQEIYRRAEQELRRRDGIYHVTIRVQADLGFVSYAGTIQRWVDPRRDASREEVDFGEGRTSISVTTPEVRVVREQDGRFTTTPARLWICHGVGLAASAVLGCPGPTERSTVQVEQAVHEGRPTVVLVSTGTLSGSDESFEFTKRLQLDAKTYLPLASASAGTVDIGRVLPTSERHVYEHEFLGRDRVPSDFFDPVSIGYAREDPAAALDRAPTDVRVHWLGSRFTAGGGLPDLALSKIDVSAPGRGPGYRYLLHYARADDPFGPPVVTLQLWPQAAWESVLRASAGANVWDDPCWSRQELDLSTGRATIFSGFVSGTIRVPAPSPGTVACPARAPDKFLAHVQLDQTVVLVDAPGVLRVGTMSKSPYDTREAIEAVVRGLRQR